MTIWLTATAMTVYAVLTILVARHTWRAALQTRGFVVRSVDGSWSKAVLSIKRAEFVALAAVERAPLEIVDSAGRVIGTLGLGVGTEPPARPADPTEK